MILFVLALTCGVPDGVSHQDWEEIRATYDAARHAAHPVGEGFHARNPGQRWRTHFDRRGFLTQPDAGGWTWGLQLERYGFLGSELEMTSPECASAEGGRVMYAWDGNLEEWYVNDTRGLEHGYTIHRRPRGKAEHPQSTLTFTLAVRGNLRPETTPDGRGVSFVDEGGAVILTYAELSVFDANGRVLEANFNTVNDGGHKLFLSVDERGARYPLIIDPIAQEAYLKASNTEGGDLFGWSVAVSGDTAVVGAKAEDSNATGVNGDQTNNAAPSAGAAYVFVRCGLGWCQQAYLKASNTDAGDLFGWSVAISGDTIVVGARGEESQSIGVNGNQSDNGAVGAGAAYIFVRSGTNWRQAAYLKASNTDAYDDFGWSVAVADDTVVVGAHGEDSNATGVNGNQNDNSAPFYAGAAYVFVRSSEGAWNQQAYLKASNTDADDLFGISVAVSGETAVVGAHGEDSTATGVNGSQGNGSASGSGAAYVFARNGTSWTQQAYLKASNTDAGDLFGYTVAVSGDTIVVGAHDEDSNAAGVNGNQTDNSTRAAGAAYVFARNGTSWTQQAYLKASNSEAGDLFGVAVAISGDTVVVGAPSEDCDATGVDGNQSDNSADHSGAVYVFLRGGAGWSQESYLKASNTDASDRFGHGVAVSGYVTVVGAYGEDSSATGVQGNQGNHTSNAGAAYLFRNDSFGDNYCASLPNSTGTAATISALGSTSLVFQDLALIADGLPPGALGLFYYGTTQLTVPFGDGLRCVGGVVRRLPVSQVDGSGVLTEPDVFALPMSNLPMAPGTLHFQAWYRDPTGPLGSGFNLSDGISIPLTP